MRTARTLSIGIGAFLTSLWAVAPVLAQTYPPPTTPAPPQPGGAGGVGAGGAGAGADGAEGLVFTGADITIGLLLIVALVGIGLAALTIGRRRAGAR